MRSTLTYRPIVPGSDKHLELMSRAQRHGRILYPTLYERRDALARAAEHRRASDVIAAAAAKVSTKHETGQVAARPVSPISTGGSGQDGCYTECA
jgi:hypothetical protein